jgi:hypothetical protein
MREVPNIFNPEHDSREIGCLGEEEFLVQCLKSGIKNITLSNGQYSNWDFIIEGKKVDVKTIINGQGPLENYYVNVSSCQVSLDQDAFAFVFHDKSKNEFKVAGVIGRDTLLKAAFHRKKGEEERNGKFRYRCDTFVLKVKDLMPVESLVGLKISG